ncbi:flavin-containing monooxygenase [Glaciimonas immobilis]|uniref:Cyclohexanone monooxygenase n=1 Tax=Glaciimonas immobilis TaxID=728004 RepID=A0A840RTN4_9BURK|nr:NAD(P)/FAD-dependent oxidoreductase [Glaciimonas immobilis]KAF3996466.1 NAD(P)/FAD-dependent oxidoreductase [Glaciimonas immobilis]MBB5201185.1 cyclohexanone monooxygenase [Glaciimonas immobilis]
MTNNIATESSVLPTAAPTQDPASNVLDAVVVGAGFAGMYMLHRLRELGLTTRAFEKGHDVGGVWYWNRYPGARCDVESMQYSYSFSEALQQEYEWSERFAAQPEILAYASHVADRFDLRRDITFQTGISAAHYNEEQGLWDICTEHGEHVFTRFCIMATGCLSSTRMPDILGIEAFEGNIYHTGNWPHTPVDFSGQRVGVIGTGSSGIQCIPVIAQQAGQLLTFQRTPNFSVPARNVPMTDAIAQHWKSNYAGLRQQARENTSSGTIYEKSVRKAHEASPEEQQAEYTRRWQSGGVNFMHSFNDLMLDIKSNDTAAEFVRGQISAIVEDPQIADLLTPKGYPIGSKRICIDTNYYSTYNRDNVTLVDLCAAPITAITPTGLQTADAHYPLDSIVFATGYDAMTGALLNIDIVGRAGETLAKKWEAGPTTYLGLMMSGFPNLFTITGPGSPSVLANMIFAIEQHVEWIADCLAWLRERALHTIEADSVAEALWVAHVNEVADTTLFPLANSWYVGANVPGKPRVFMPYVGGVVPYRRKCNEVAAQGYEGFNVSARS